jgi:hypothetical protein
MAIVREGIGDIRVFVLPDGTTEDGRSAAVSRAALVTWHSAHLDKLHQAYVNSRLAGATIDVLQRQLVVQLPGVHQSATRVAVVAVEPQDAHRDFSDDLDQDAASTGRVRLTLLRSQSLPIGATASIYCDWGAGQIDYDRTLNASPIPIWPCPQDKAGHGMSQFGEGDFGYDAAASIGFAAGAFGRGRFGLDADLIECIGPVLAPGQYRFAVTITDESGNEGPPSEMGPLCIVPSVTPAAALDVATFEPVANELTLSITG